MGKLHEVLAVESGLKRTAEVVLNEAKDTFSKKKGHFLGQHRRYEKLHDQGLDHLPEHKEVIETVDGKLEYVSEHLVRMLDAVAQKEFTNQEARADVILEGTTVLKDVPATLLLTLESKLNEIRSLYQSIPTLDPGFVWSIDVNKKHIYKSQDVETHTTQKVVEPLLLYQATDKHPAQVDKITIDKIIGKWITTYFTGAISPAEKSDYLARIDTLMRAVKQARVRANDCEIKNVKIGKVVLDFINGA